MQLLAPHHSGTAHPFSRAWFVLVTCVGALFAACTSPLELGETRYQEGDQVGALEAWRRVDADDAAYPETQQRIAEVEDEFRQLVLRYVQRGRYFEEKGRLAESVLNHRLSLRLKPDPETLAHVQQLVRVLATRRAAVHERFSERFAAGDLSGARAALQDLRELDPFWPGAVSDEQALQAAWQSEIERLLAWGRVGFDADNLPHAERAFRDVLALDASNETALGYLAFIEQARVDGAATRTATEAEIRAEGFYRNALGVEARGDPYAAIALDLEALAADDKHKGAKRHLDAIRTRLADEVPALIEAGRRFYRRQNLQAALDQWRRALLVDPDNVQARDYSRRAERLLENLERIREDPLPGVSAGPGTS